MPSTCLYVSQNALPPSEDDERLAAALRCRDATVRIAAWDDARTGELTHSVLRRAAPGEFRVQANYGGRSAVTSPPAEVRTAATRALKLLGHDHVGAIPRAQQPDASGLTLRDAVGVGEWG